MFKKVPLQNRTLLVATRGFTIIELVAVIVVMGILSVSLTGILTLSMKSHLSANNRLQMVNDGRFVIERISREVRTALPNSIRVGSNGAVQCVEFVPISFSATYAIGELPTAAALNRIDVVDFDYSTVTNNYVAAAIAESKHFYDSSENRRHPLQGVGAKNATTNLRRITLTSAQTFNQDSPTRRLYIVQQPVSFCATSSRIYRYSGYGISTTQAVPPAGGVLFTEGMDTSDLVNDPVFEEKSTGNDSMLILDAKFSQDSETVRFSREVFLHNVI